MTASAKTRKQVSMITRGSAGFAKKRPALGIGIDDDDLKSFEAGGLLHD